MGVDSTTDKQTTALINPHVIWRCEPPLRTCFSRRYQRRPLLRFHDSAEDCHCLRLTTHHPFPRKRPLFVGAGHQGVLHVGVPMGDQLLPQADAARLLVLQAHAMAAVEPGGFIFHTTLYTRHSLHTSLPLSTHMPGFESLTVRKVSNSGRWHI